MELHSVLHEWIVPSQWTQGFIRIVLGSILTSAQSEKQEQPHMGKTADHTLEVVGMTKPEWSLQVETWGHHPA